jgi:vacuolar-type H+-ATPase subunit I/STV1
VKDLPPVQNKDDDTITEDLSDEPEEEAVEEEKEHDIGIPAINPAQTEHENAVDNLMEEEKKKQEMINVARMNENKLIVQKINDVIGELKKIEKRDDRNNQQFSEVSRKYEEMKTYIDEYINNNLIQYETDFDTNPDMQQRYADFKKRWEFYFEWRLQNQYSFLTEKYSDTVPFLRKRADLIYMLKELRNYINVNLFGKKEVWGGKTKRRYRRKTIRKRVSKKQTKKFRRI